MTIETYEDIPEASDNEVVEFLREQIWVVLEKADMKRKIFIAAFNTILNDINKRLASKEITPTLCASCEYLVGTKLICEDCFEEFKRLSLEND